MNFDRSVITLTFGDAAENHVGMEMIGHRGLAGTGFTMTDLEEIAARTANSEIYRLTCTMASSVEEAAVLVVRGALDQEHHRMMFNEHAALDHDKKALMYGRVVNKKARWNLCFDDCGHEPDYSAGKGRVIALKDVPLTKELVDSFPERFGEKAHGLKGEGNYYYDIQTCGIGWHGDTERRKVVAVRLGGARSPICFQWYRGGVSHGEKYEIPLNGGDLYIMSEKAVGSDWKMSSRWTLRHATGAHARMSS
jgi:hypothetical protein